MIQAQVAAWLTVEQRTTDLLTARADTDGVTGVLSHLRLWPMSSDCRVAILRAIDAIDEDNLACLVAYIHAPSPTGRLMLTGVTEPPASLVAQLRRASHVYELRTLETPAARRELARAFFQSRGQRMTREAEQLMDELVRSTGETASPQLQLEQVSTYAGAQTTIDRALIEQLMQPVTEHTVFEFTEAVGHGDAGRAVTLMHEHAKERRRIHELLGLLGWHFRRLWEARIQRDAGESPSAIARQLRLPRRAEASFLQQVQRWAIPDLRCARQLLLQADERLKRGAGEPKLLLELVVLTLIGVPDGSPAATSFAPPYSGGSHLSAGPDQGA